MKYPTRLTASFAVSLSLLVGQAAVAATVVVDKPITTGDAFYVQSSSAALALVSSVMSQLPTAGITFSAIAPGVYNSATTTVNTTASAFNYDNVSNNLLTFQTAGGGNFNMPTAKTILFTKIGGPGSISFTDLSIDINSKQISALVSGANGLTTSRQNIFAFASYTGDTTFKGAGTYNFSANTITLTTAGINAFTQGLALTAAGSSVFSKVSDLGKLSGNYVVAAVQPVPEPSSYALMALGLLGVAVVTRKNRKA